jgi:hypothetical protein
LPGDGATDRARSAAGRRKLSVQQMGKAVPPPTGTISFTVSWLPDGGVWRPPSSGDLRLPSGAYSLTLTLSLTLALTPTPTQTQTHTQTQTQTRCEPEP